MEKSKEEILNGTNDDGEALVQQVLNENPAKDQGVRDEWKDQVGWHRKEDISLLRGVGGKKPMVFPSNKTHSGFPAKDFDQRLRLNKNNKQREELSNKKDDEVERRRMGSMIALSTGTLIIILIMVRMFRAGFRVPSAQKQR